MLFSVWFLKPRSSHTVVKSAAIKRPVPTLLPCVFVSPRLQQRCFFFFSPYDHVLSVRNSVCPAVPPSNIHPNPVFQQVMEGAICLLRPLDSEWKGKGKVLCVFSNTHLTFQCGYYLCDVNWELSVTVHQYLYAWWLVSLQQTGFSDRPEAAFGPGWLQKTLAAERGLHQISPLPLVYSNQQCSCCSCNKCWWVVGNLATFQTSGQGWWNGAV